jgi:two-component system LytT family sensor kinase
VTTRTKAFAVFLAWTLVGLVGVCQWYLLRLSAGIPLHWGGFLAGTFQSCWLWAAFTPAIVRLARRFRLERGSWARNLLLHFGFSLGFGFLDTLVGAGIDLLVPLGPQRPLLIAFLGQSFIEIFSYFAVVAIAHAVDYYALFHEREVAASRLEAQLLSAQLQSLEMQLRPHFLFNTLHTVASLVRTRRNADAVRMIAGLSDLLRSSLRPDAAAEVPLREELAFVQRYLEIERIRFQDRLRTRITAGPEVLDALVPSLILQPLVENAIRHGIELRAAPGEIVLEADRQNGTLRLRVQDSSSGSSIVSPGRSGTGIGLSNTQARLRHLYGDRQHFELAATPEGGAVARIELPFHRDPLDHGRPPTSGATHGAHRG